MELKEAYEQAGDNDKLTCTVEEETTTSTEKKNIDNFDVGYRFAISNQWKIIAAKKEPVSTLEVAEACFKCNGRFGDPTSFEISLVTEGAKNERLIFEPLLDALQKYEDDDSIEYHKSGITEALAKIKLVTV